MSEPRFYPDEPVDTFPRPPREITDDTDRVITLEAIDPAASSDPLLEMYDAFAPEDRAQGIPPLGPERLREWLDMLAEGYNAAAWDGDAPVGHATLVPDDNGGYELAIFVLQSHQNAGIGTELLRTLLGLGQREGVKRVWLTVERWNRAAVHVYERVGFETTNAASFELEMSIRL